ncbi:bifunctional adenosylcobinamide kinase/adenosylcobinamide-phosphate guanylyltransferase [Nocardia sp. CNY236]|uniref:bifunctional adenosylcobinamide kinase/adenosylcobinamide-phosphate guanylyltransferase n=1 Tax=Nocardia sp. CNY236 TaxID=1169152 RepID=UPI00041609FA|nr:bifunctional adenosylcobinamide kinase/adenosylcobinamide-phosphate guanylyltransferase [Nocardia sp. CNY236]
MPHSSSPATHRRTLVLGGARSGKSAFAEELAARDGGAVRYVATAIPDPDDHDFTARITEHRDRRPVEWSTIESADLATVLIESPQPPNEPALTLVDDIGTWLTARLDAREAWQAPRGTIGTDTDALVAAVGAYCGPLVIVTSEVGMGVVPATRSGRLFRDEIGLLNQRLARVCDEAILVVAGLPQRLK